MQAAGNKDVIQASVPTNLVHVVVEPIIQNFGDSSHSGGEDNCSEEIWVEIFQLMSKLTVFYFNCK
jgi:hypothetical protein